MDEVIRLPDGRLRVPAYVQPGADEPSCGLATTVIGPGHPDYARYAKIAATPRPSGRGADDVVNQRFAAREAAEARRTVALKLPSGNLLLPASQWARGVYELAPGDPDFTEWGRSAISEAEWERQWSPAVHRTRAHRRSA